MNEIAKQNIADRITEALQKEQLSKNQAGPLLGVKSPYLSLVTTRAHWKGCPESTWDELLKWVNSGLTIKGYSEKHYRTLSETKSEKNVPKTKETVSEPVKIVTKPKKEVSIEEKKPHPRLSNGQMVDLLLEEKQRLSIQIDAIDVLLKHYIS